MLTKFRRNAYRVPKGPAKPAAVVARPPGWCLFNTEARESAATVCAKRGLATARPDAWEAFPDQGQAKLYLTPAEQSEKFPVSIEQHPELGWALVLHLNERSQTTPEDLADVDEAAAASELS